MKKRAIKKCAVRILAAGLMACGMSLQLSAGEAGFLSVRDFGAKGDEGE